MSNSPDAVGQGQVDALSFGSVASILSVGMTIAGELMGVEAQLASGQPVTVPTIKTYLGSAHVNINITIQEVAS